ncbi:RidA family protein [Sneathiella glossodoripedis]|uniref:RidA family protein n=1 Tax=Sneathiella glossodoripedis TaxID=418853 RepID=UPI000470CEEA|nr:RidA family protein [Sneathiella glossodoripedis]
MVKHISSGSIFEEQIGYSRAVVDDHYVHVAGTTGYDYSTMQLAKSAYDQAVQCLKNIEHALQEAGSSLDKVVRATYILPDGKDFESCWPALKAAFAKAKPAATMIQVQLMNPEMKIEIEVTALK